MEDQLLEVVLSTRVTRKDSDLIEIVAQREDRRPADVLRHFALEGLRARGLLPRPAQPKQAQKGDQ